MMPVGPLMKEHRLIERMVRIMDVNVENFKRENKINPLYIDIAVDFIRTYADRCHHGKEEDILFRALAKKNISGEHRKIMDELVKEHVMGRNNLKNLAEAKEKYIQGSKNVFKDILFNIEMLIKFYPRHIEKEDKHFFIQCMDYFTEKERQSMLNEMWEFDRNMIHDKYTKLVVEHEKQ